MPRIARLVVPGIPHHIVQRGNRSMPVFFNENDRLIYLRLLRQVVEKYSLKIWAYCLMSNHVHLIIVPESDHGLAQALAYVHQQYSRMINFRLGWRGYLWQGRFFSCPMDESYLYAAVRYVEQNPVRAALVNKAEDYKWSSAKARVYGDTDPVISDFFMTAEIKNWSSFLSTGQDKNHALLEKHLRTGKPLGSYEFIKKLEKISGRILLS